MKDLAGKFPPRLRQFYVALGPILITTSLGMAEGYSAILIPQLEREMQIDEQMASWIASMTALPMALGCILGGWAMERIGRKLIHMLTCAPCIGGWLVIYWAWNIDMILAGRFLTGFCVGLLGPPTGVYMSETSDPKFRGFLLGAVSFAIAFGVSLAHLFGIYFTWQTTALICCIFPVLCVLVMIWAPESPTFLAKRGQLQEAQRAFRWCRGTSPEAEKELQVLIERQQLLTEAPKRSMFQTIKDLRKPEFVKPLLILCTFFTTLQWAGNNVLPFYCVQIVRQTIGQNLNETLIMIILDSIRLVMSILACLLIKKLKRRTLAVISLVGTFLSLSALSLHVFLSRFDARVQSLTYIPMLALVSYMTFLTIGFVPLPWTMMGEVFPLANRGTGSGISAMVNYIMIFAVIKTMPGMFVSIGADGTFLTYALCTLLGAVVLIAYLPETKDKPLHVIEDYFKRKTNSDNKA